METDRGLEAVRKVRHDISRELGNDPAQLVAHYLELQRDFKGQIITGSDDVAQQGDDDDEAPNLATPGRLPRGSLPR